MLNNMFENIGSKIKNLVRFFAVAGMLIFIALGVFIALFANVLIGISVGTIGFLLSWVGSWLLYGYGEMIQRLINIDQKLGVGNNNFIQTIKPAEATPMPEKDKETLYQFALEEINKEQYKIACNTLKRILDYKDSKELLNEIENKVKSFYQNQ